MAASLARFQPLLHLLLLPPEPLTSDPKRASKLTFFVGGGHSFILVLFVCVAHPYSFSVLCISVVRINSDRKTREVGKRRLWRASLRKSVVDFWPAKTQCTYRSDAVLSSISVQPYFPASDRPLLSIRCQVSSLFSTRLSVSSRSIHMSSYDKRGQRSDPGFERVHGRCLRRLRRLHQCLRTENP